MAKPFDATLKQLIQAHPEDWLRAFVGPLAGPVETLNADLSSVTAATDVVFRAGGRAFAIDFESGPNEHLERRTLRYNVLAHDLTGVPVHSLVILLRPRADRGDLRNFVEYEAVPGRGKLRFEFEVVRLWQVPAEQLLAAGIGVVPLAVLGQLAPGQPVEDAIAPVIQTVARRLEAEVPEPEANDLLTSAFILTGLRLSKAIAARLFHGVRNMRDSSTYELILDEGKVSGFQELLLAQGRERFGEPSEEVVQAIQGLNDPDRLFRMGKNIFKAADWRELLATE